MKKLLQIQFAAAFKIISTVDYLRPFPGACLGAGFTTCLGACLGAGFTTGLGACLGAGFTITGFGGAGFVTTMGAGFGGAGFVTTTGAGFGGGGGAGR